MSEREPSIETMLAEGDKIDPEQRILLAAIQDIEDEGIQNVTIRGIAKRAGVNSAAINYYYRSKDRLLDQVMDYTLENAFGDVTEFIPDGPIDSTDPIKAYLRHMLWGMRQYPGICRAHLYAPLVESQIESRAVDRFNALMGSICDRMQHRVPHNGQMELKWGLVQLVSSLLMSGLAPDVFHEFLGDALQEQTQIDAYVDDLVDRILGSYFQS